MVNMYLCLLEAVLSSPLCPVCCVATLIAPMCWESYLYCKCVYFVGALHCTWLSLSAAQSFALIAAHPVLGHLTFCELFHDMSCCLAIIVLVHTDCCHLCCMAALMMIGHCHAALPLACSFASVKLLCLCHVTLAVSFCLPLSYSFAFTLLLFPVTLLHFIHSALP